MERRYTLEGGGSLTVRADELRAVLTAERASDSRGLYKAYLRGPTGRALLGTLAPENGQLRVRRTLTLDTLERQGAWPPVGGELELAFAFGREKAPSGWSWTEPEKLTFGEETLRAMAVRQGRALFQPMDGGFRLAYSFSCARPFPLPGLFCLARLGMIEGERHICFQFDRKGWPILPDGGRGTGVC